MSLIEPQRRKVAKEISRKQVTFLYKLQLGPKKVKVCQKMLCYVLGVTPRRIKVLQDKMKNAKGEIDLSNKRGKHSYKPNKITEDAIQKIRDHIESVKNPFASDLWITKMYQDFCKQYPEIQVSRKNYENLWRESDSCFGEADSLEDFDDPVNERLSPHELISVETIKCEPESKFLKTNLFTSLLKF